MLLILLLLFTHVSFLSAFQPKVITPSPLVGYKEISFFDESYQQTRKILIWYPVEKQTRGSPSQNIWDVFDIAVDVPISNPEIKKPLIVISHGYRSSPNQLSWLINKLIYNNYVVVGMQHLDEINGEPQIHIWKRAEDIHTLLDKLSLQSFASYIDLNSIGFAGFSIGGTTGIWIIGGLSNRLDNFIPTSKDIYAKDFDINAIKQAFPTLDKKKMVQSWKDSRIKAAFLMAPSWAWIFDINSLQNITIPTYIIAPIADNVLVTQSNAGFFAKNIPNSFYEIILGQGSHYLFFSIPKEKDKLPSNLDFLIKDAPGIDREWIQFEVAREAASFFQSVFSTVPNQKF